MGRLVWAGTSPPFLGKGMRSRGVGVGLHLALQLLAGCTWWFIKRWEADPSPYNKMLNISQCAIICVCSDPDPDESCAWWFSCFRKEGLFCHLPRWSQDREKECHMSYHWGGRSGWGILIFFFNLILLISFQCSTSIKITAESTDESKFSFVIKTKNTIRGWWMFGGPWTMLLERARVSKYH